MIERGLMVERGAKLKHVVSLWQIICLAPWGLHIKIYRHLLYQNFLYLYPKILQSILVLFAPCISETDAGKVHQLIAIFLLFPKGFAFQVSLLFLICIKAQNHSCFMSLDLFSLNVEYLACLMLSAWKSISCDVNITYLLYLLCLLFHFLCQFESCICKPHLQAFIFHHWSIYPHYKIRAFIMTSSYNAFHTFSSPSTLSCYPFPYSPWFFSLY